MPGGKGKPDRRAGGVRPPRRALAVTRIADLRRRDHVLDVGCAEGLVSLEVAGLVERLVGLDINPARVQQATDRAAERGIRNASFAVGAIQEYPFDPRSWDVTLFMRVWGKSGGAGSGVVGPPEFERILEATRRQAIVQAGKLRSEQGLMQLFEICDEQGFDTAWFVSLNLLVANRRAAGARIHALPERVFVRGRSGPALVPSRSVRDHPVIRSFDPNLPVAV